MDNNSNKTTTDMKPVIIIGKAGTGKTTMANEIIARDGRRKAIYIHALNSQLDKGIMPWEILSGIKSSGTMVIEGVCKYKHVLGILDTITSLRDGQQVKIIFTSQNIDPAKVNKQRFKIINLNN